MITFLPEDIIELILAWIPASTLTRYRTVCKQWNRIIRDPQFIMAHLQHAPHHPLLFYNRSLISDRLYPSEAIFFDEVWSPSRWNVPVIEPDDIVCASCNGLVLLYSDKSTIKIANLSTGECLRIAKPGRRNLKGDPYCFYNFGFHPVTKEYKIIHILCHTQHISGDSFSIIQVYTLGEGKWREIRVPEVQSSYHVNSSGVVIVDGAMYWFDGKKESKWGRALVSFDLSEERFEWIQLPTIVDLANSVRGCSRVYYITEVDGKVCVVTGQERIVSRWLVGKLQVWALDNKIDQSWSQKYNIQLSSVNIPRSYFIHRGKIVVYDYDRNIYYHELMAQNVETERRKMVKLLNFGPRWFRTMQIYKHVESLVRLDAYSKVGTVCTPKRQEGWESKKWARWTQELFLLEKLWRRAYALEHFVYKLAHGIGMDINLQLEPPPEKSRLNWVEQKRVRGMLKASTRRLAVILMDLERTMDATQNKKTTNETDQSSSSPNTDVSGESTTMPTALKIIKASIRCLFAELGSDITV